MPLESFPKEPDAQKKGLWTSFLRMMKLETDDSHNQHSSTSLDQSVKASVEEVKEIPQDHWMPDSTCKECYECKVPFTTFRRRHHCRICGQIFCHKCTSIVPGDSFGYSSDIRTCIFCFHSKNQSNIPFFSNSSNTHLLSSASFPDEQDLIEENFKTVYSIEDLATDEAMNWQDEQQESDSLVQFEIENALNPDDIKLDWSSFQLSLNNPSIGPLEFEKTRHIRRFSLSEIEMNSPKRNSFRGTFPRYSKNDQHSEPVLFKSLPPCYLSHLDSLIAEFLKQEGLEDLVADTVEPLQKLVLNSLVNFHLSTDSFNLKNCIKVKKVAGGSFSDSKSIPGICFTKKILDYKLLKQTDNPRLVLLACPLQYERTNNQFISIDTLILQEKEYIGILCSRVVATGCNMIFSSQNISKLAFDMLLDAGVLPYFNLKSSTLSKISLITELPICYSIDDLKTFGQSRKIAAQVFINTFRNSNQKKSILYLQSKELVPMVTVLLRSPHLQQLDFVKRMLPVLFQVSYNMLKEASLIRDLDILQPSKSNVHSGSPFIEYPFISKPHFNPSVKSTERFFVNFCENNLRMTVLLSINSLIKGAQCSAPHLELIEFYSASDMTLEQYLSSLVSSSSLPCESCQKPLINHYRNFAHANLKVGFRIESVEPLFPGLEQTVLIWTKCTHCSSSSNITGLLQDSVNLSFGKYLQLLFYSKITASCGHDFFKDQLIFFHYENFRITQSFEPIELFTIKVPDAQIAKAAPIQLKEMNEMKSRIDVFFDSIQSKIMNFNFDVIATNQHEECTLALNDLLNTCYSERKLELQKLQQINNITIYQSINESLRDLMSLVSKWEDRFNRLVQRHLVSDVSDFRKMTTNQLRKLFIDKESENLEFKDKELVLDLPLLGSSPAKRATTVKPEMSSFSASFFTENDESVIFSEEPSVHDSLNLTMNSWNDSEQVEASILDELEMSTPKVEARDDFEVKTPIPRQAQPKPVERGSLVKTLTSFWIAGLGQQLFVDSPLQPNEHLFPDSSILVRETEPSSIIAHTLCSTEYNERISEAVMSMETLPGSHFKYRWFQLIVEFSNSESRVFCKIFFADQFHVLRDLSGLSQDFIQSLCRCANWEVGGGKSGSSFMKTADDRLILKQLSRFEMDSLLKFAPVYFQYMSEVLLHQVPTSLVKIFGFYRIGLKNSVTGNSLKMDVLVMENLFFNHKISRIFDLKGSMRNRHVQSTGRQDQVLLDENLMELLTESPLFITESCSNILRACVWNDTLFLSKLDIMDYSLLVGIEEKTNTLIIGIVDYVRTFTWDKKLESWVKESGILGGGGKEPTIISPNQYKERFREAMEKYFLLVPLISNTNQ